MVDGFNVTAPGYVVVAGEDAGDSFGVGEVLLGEDASRERLGCVLVFDGDCALQNDDAMVEQLVDEVDGATGDLGAVFKGLPLGVEAGKTGQQAGVNVEDALRKCSDEGGREQAQVAGEADEIDGVLLQSGDTCEVALHRRAAGDGNGKGGQAECAGGVEAWSVGFVREHDGYFGIRDLAGSEGLVDGEEVRAAAGEQDAETLQRESSWVRAGQNRVESRTYPKPKSLHSRPGVR